MKDTKVQWHPGFVAAMNLELAKNRNDLIFVKEYNLNTKPLEVDLLVIKSNKVLLFIFFPFMPQHLLSPVLSWLTSASYKP